MRITGERNYENELLILSVLPSKLIQKT